MNGRKIVYLAHPLSGDWEGNIASARRYAEAAARNGWVPVAPYLTLYGLLHEPADRELGLEIDLAMIIACDEIWVCGDRVSSGMRIELDYALANDIPVRFVGKSEDVPSAQ
jgi:nucleoside 2-deoxyribosyltransferase